MSELCASEWLEVWERGAGRSSTEQSLEVLSAVDPYYDRPALAGLSLGERNAALLGMCRDLYGPWLRCVVDCPACGARLELDLGVGDLAAVGADDQGEPAGPATVVVEADGLRVTGRGLTAADLLAVQASPSLAAARLALIERAVLSVSPTPGSPPLSGDSMGPAELPEGAVAALASALSEIDALADPPLETVCAACGRTWRPRLDPAWLVWQAVERVASQLLDDVDRLARSYGWREADILNLSPRRRRAYLERIGAGD